MSFTSNVKDDYDTEVVRINDIGTCDNCRDERDDLLEITYTEWTQLGSEMMTPSGRYTEVVCDNCFDEYY